MPFSLPLIVLLQKITTSSAQQSIQYPKPSKTPSWRCRYTSGAAESCRGCHTEEWRWRDQHTPREWGDNPPSVSKPIMEPPDNYSLSCLAGISFAMFLPFMHLKDCRSASLAQIEFAVRRLLQLDPTTNIMPMVMTSLMLRRLQWVESAFPFTESKTNGRHFYYIWSSFRTIDLQWRSVMCTLTLLINMNVCTNLFISLLWLFGLIVFFDPLQ